MGDQIDETPISPIDLTLSSSDKLMRLVMESKRTYAPISLIELQLMSRDMVDKLNRLAKWDRSK